MARSNGRKGKASKGTTNTVETPVQANEQTGCVAVTEPWHADTLDSTTPSVPYVLPIPQAPACPVCAGFGCVACPPTPAPHCGACCGLGCGVCNVPFAKRRMGHGASAMPRQPRQGSNPTPTTPNATALAPNASNGHVLPNTLANQPRHYFAGAYNVLLSVVANMGGATTLAQLRTALRDNPAFANGECIGTTVSHLRSVRKFGAVLLSSEKLGAAHGGEHLRLTDAGRAYLAVNPA